MITSMVVQTNAIGNTDLSELAQMADTLKTIVGQKVQETLVAIREYFAFVGQNEIPGEATYRVLHSFLNQFDNNSLGKNRNLEAYYPMTVSEVKLISEAGFTKSDWAVYLYLKSKNPFERERYEIDGETAMRELGISRQTLWRAVKKINGTFANFTAVVNPGETRGRKPKAKAQKPILKPKMGDKLFQDCNKQAEDSEEIVSRSEQTNDKLFQDCNKYDPETNAQSGFQASSNNEEEIMKTTNEISGGGTGGKPPSKRVVRSTQRAGNAIQEKSKDSWIDNDEELLSLMKELGITRSAATDAKMMQHSRDYSMAVLRHILLNKDKMNAVGGWFNSAISSPTEWQLDPEAYSTKATEEALQKEYVSEERQYNIKVSNEMISLGYASHRCMKEGKLHIGLWAGGELPASGVVAMYLAGHIKHRNFTDFMPPDELEVYIEKIHKIFDQLKAEAMAKKALQQS